MATLIFTSADNEYRFLSGFLDAEKKYSFVKYSDYLGLNGLQHFFRKQPANIRLRKDDHHILLIRGFDAESLLLETIDGLVRNTDETIHQMIFITERKQGFKGLEEKIRQIEENIDKLRVERDENERQGIVLKIKRYSQEFNVVMINIPDALLVDSNDKPLEIKNEFRKRVCNYV